MKKEYTYELIEDLDREVEELDYDESEEINEPILEDGDEE